MAINYEDQRLEAVEQERQDALNKAQETYGGMIEKTNQLYQEQIDATKAWEEQQKQLQQKQTDFAIEQTQRQKEQAEKDYMKEQSAAYADWQKEKNSYGVAAEQMAEAGLAGSGYSESAQLSMYNTYQARVTAARESITQAVADFDAAMQAAVLQNDVAMAEIAFQALQQRMTLSLEGFQYENQLILALEDEKKAIEADYDSQWQTVLEQLYAEEAEAIRAAQESEGLGNLGGEEPAYIENPTSQQGATADLNPETVETALTDDGSGGYVFNENAGAKAQKPSTQAIKNMQISLGLEPTGRFDAATRAATGSQSVTEAYNLWNQGKIAKKAQGSWRQTERTNDVKIVIDDSIPKAISDAELERMLATGEAILVQNGNTITVKKATALDAFNKKRTSGVQANPTRTAQYGKEASDVAKALQAIANAFEKKY